MWSRCRWVRTTRSISSGSTPAAASSSGSRPGVRPELAKLAKQLERLTHDRQRLNALTNAVQQPRSMMAVAVDMLTLYHRLVPQSRFPAAVSASETYA